MSEQDQVVQPQVEQEQELEINLDGDTQVETVSEDTVPKTQYNQVFARMKKLEEAVKKSRETSTTTTPQPTVDTKGSYRDEVYDLRLDGYSRDEADFIMKNGGRKALETNTFVKVAIEKIREQKKAEQAIPDDTSEKSDIERKYTPEQLRNMSSADLAKILPHA